MVPGMSPSKYVIMLNCDNPNYEFVNSPTSQLPRARILLFGCRINYLQCPPNQRIISSLLSEGFQFQGNYEIPEEKKRTDANFSQCLTNSLFDLK